MFANTIAKGVAILLIAGIGNFASADSHAERLSEEQLQSLFSAGLNFTVERNNDSLDFQYKSDGEWEVETNTGRSGSGHWKIKGNKVYRSGASVPPQPVDATHALNLSAGVSNSNVFRGRSFS